MPDERHADIFARPPRLVLPPAPVITRPPVAHPTCPQHCTGRHEVEGVIACPSCGGHAYRVVAHEWVGGEGGHYFYAMEPLSGSPPWDGTARCCGRPMERRS